MPAGDVVSQISLLTVATSAISAIAGGVVVGFFNHYFQIRREYIRHRKEKLEQIVVLTVKTTSLCEKLFSMTLNIDDPEQARKVQQIVENSDDRFYIESGVEEIKALIFIHYNKSIDLVNDFAYKAGKALTGIHVLIYRIMMDRLGGENVYNERQATIDNLNDTRLAGKTLIGEIIGQTEWETQSMPEKFFIFVKYFLRHSEKSQTNSNKKEGSFLTLLVSCARDYIGL